MIIFFVAMVLIVIGIIGVLSCRNGNLKWWGYASVFSFILGFLIIFDILM